MGLGYADLSSKNDMLGVDRYYTGLMKFITECETPMTLSIQGDWGTGKTTALNLIEKKLESENPGRCHVLWFRTWQYSKFGMEDNMTLALMTNLYGKLQEVAKAKDIDIKKHKIPLLHGIREAALSIADATVGSRATDKLETITNTLLGENVVPSVAKQIEDTKSSIQELINLIISNEEERLVIFVDDLDRLEPKTAIDLLEGIKNFLDCEKCVFVLAVDSSVIYQGIKSKYGDDFGEDKAKKFFDKIIQVPFTLPVNQYDTKGYIKQFLPENDQENLQHYDETIRTILGSNPRSIKRAFNLLKLHELILENIIKNEKDRLNLFTILLIQMSDEKLYGKMVELARKSSNEVKEEMKKDEYALVRKALKLPEYLNENQCAEIEDEEQWSDFIELLIETSRVSSNKEGAQVTSTVDENNSSTVQMDNISRFLTELEGLYKKDCVNDSIINFWSKDGKIKICSFRFSEEYTNIVIYSIEGKKLDRLTIEGTKDKSECKRNGEAIEEDEIGYYYSSDHITLVEIRETSNLKLVWRVFKFYNIID